MSAKGVEGLKSSSRKTRKKTSRGVLKCRSRTLEREDQVTDAGRGADRSITHPSPKSPGEKSEILVATADVSS